jgi:hypothetical protein
MRAPENPPLSDFNLPLVEHYPPHGFPPYLGLGLLNTATLRLEPGGSTAEYLAGEDLVYRVRGTFSPTKNPGVSTACGAVNASWEIEEFFGGQPWRKTGGYQTLSQVFFHHCAGQLPTENPRIGAILRRLTEEYLVAAGCKHRCSYLMFPAGYLYAIRLPLTDDTLDAFKQFAAEPPRDIDAPPPTIGEPLSVAILKADTSFQTRIERGIVSDISVAAVRLLETLDRLASAKAVAGSVHLRPEVIYAHETARKFSRVHPGRLSDNVVTYQVIPVDDETPPPAALVETFANESLEIFYLVHEALRATPPQDTPAEPT